MSDTLFTTNEPYAEEIADLVEIGMLNEVEIDYEAMETYLHATIYTARREEAMLDRDAIKWIVAQLIVCGIGVDDDAAV